MDIVKIFNIVNIVAKIIVVASTSASILSIFDIFHLASEIVTPVTSFYYEWFSDETLASCWSSSANCWDHCQGRAVWSFKVFSWSCFILTPGNTYSQYFYGCSYFHCCPGLAPTPRSEESVRSMRLQWSRSPWFRYLHFYLGACYFWEIKTYKICWNVVVFSSLECKIVSPLPSFLQMFTIRSIKARQVKT